MAACLISSKNLSEKVTNGKTLVVGAGGIGCELIKNLVLTGFNNIELIDLDIIDVSNLNRQFLFRKEHVGKSKAHVAKESALKFNPGANIIAYHDSIMNPDYGTDFFKNFNLVLNALDNRAARNHVNRMCLAADVPLVESGTAGFLGQVTLIKKGLTECYECKPAPTQKTFPGCTIRNTPSEPIHCIVWAKHLFNQLFGEDDPDEDVSPDTEDPEHTADAGEEALHHQAKEGFDGGIERKSTRAWAVETDFNPEKLFHKFFKDDIKYLLSMQTLWKKRRPPVPLDWNSLPDTVEGDTNSNKGKIKDQKIWSMRECRDMFGQSLGILKENFKNQGEDAMLVWDKDDEGAMDFVTATANIRAHIFGIPVKSRFDIKSMAGNIIPAIATTNAIIAGLIVTEALKILEGRIKDCRTIYLSRKPNPRGKILVPCQIETANPKCYVCAPRPEATVRLNTKTITVRSFEEKIMKKEFGMVAPDIEIGDQGVVLVSSEEGETEENSEKHLADFGIRNGTRLSCDDFLQEYNLIVNILHSEDLEDDKEFEVVGDVSELGPKEAATSAENGDKQSGANNGTAANGDDDEVDAVMILDNDDASWAEGAAAKSRKRKPEDTEDPPAKKVKISGPVEVEDDEILILDDD
ncbi:SUMO-activating enzyme subunit 2-like [Lineus longissimus]|uniref:SUMO-activating enzyme subunit 2-like n=1 Tax=Lineus longissimus TaxID=88925 RepID=UPI002B4F6530